jgi:hypothetical protein
VILTVKIKLTTPYLGELKPDRGSVRRFKKQGQMIAVNVAQWQEQFRLAARQIGVDFDPKTIQPQAHFRPAAIHLFVRRFNRIQQENFESFRAGTVLTLEFLIREDLPKCPKPSELKTMLMIVGEYFGLSQFGNGFGFGRFKVLSVEPKEIGVAETA